MSDLTSFSTQREVEANETEMANTCLDSCSAAASAPLCSGSTRVDAEGAGDAVAPLHDTGSYFQVVVEKHRHKRSASCRRVPMASSPRADAGSHRIASHPVLFACYNCGACCAVAPPAPAPAPRVPDRELHCTAAPPCDDGPGGLVRDVQEDKLRRVFGSMNGASVRDEDTCVTPIGPDRVEVYRFERGCGEYLRTAGDAREAVCSRAARRPARAARTALAEVLALAGLLLRAPLASLLLVQRCALEVARDAIGGCVRDVSDYALKPALAATFNAAAHPALVFAANAGHALRAATAPFVGMALDALEPLVRVLGAVRLVEVHVYSPPPPPAHPI
ncbi:hypothetical protein K1T71_011586 [Dendrolimus kikuchii]|uniref:Uncharacterized protein n=1 Tax=Dendrolimus kikuchii TaxID=765133 RepID=A0ACC1CLT4_9NEOP|nr:hypothetical protein K1T71_011586 [Dendrolimus kikuchii]